MLPYSTLPLIAAFLVFPLWILEQFMPYPWLVEELAKYLSFYILVKQRPQNAIWIVLMAGISFGFSEAVLNQVNNLQFFNPENIIHRFIYTLPMHTLTYTISYLGITKKKYFYIFLILSITIHYLFNSFVKNF